LFSIKIGAKKEDRKLPIDNWLCVRASNSLIFLLFTVASSEFMLGECCFTQLKSHIVAVNNHLTLTIWFFDWFSEFNYHKFKFKWTMIRSKSTRTHNFSPKFSPSHSSRGWMNDDKRFGWKHMRGTCFVDHRTHKSDGKFSSWASITTHEKKVSSCMASEYCNRRILVWSPRIPLWVNIEFMLRWSKNNPNQIVVYFRWL
jgi:hypothetical protein